MRELKLTQIWIYPIKALGGINLYEANVMAKGLQYDRRWMLVDQNGVFMTQRGFSILTLFKSKLTKGSLEITYNGDMLSLPLNHTVMPEPLEVQIWDDRVVAYEVSHYHSQWFTERVGINCRLVAFPEENPRQIDTAYALPGANVSLADGYPFLIIGQNSLEDLNSRLSEPLSMKRFRPNFVFTGGDAFEEDTWKAFSIGDGNFEGVKPCARCAVPSIDPETGEKGVEPLKTLAAFRRWNNKIYFGQNAIAHGSAVVRVNDLITVHNSFQMSEQLLAIGSRV